MTQNNDPLTTTLAQRGVTRRDFLKFCAAMTAALAMPASVSTVIAKALEATTKRPPVIWLEMQDCAGCSESFLRASRPSAAEVVLDTLSVDYHETIMAAAGFQAEEAKQKTIAAGGYLLVVEGSLSTADDGVYCCVGGKSSTDLLKEAAANATAIIAVGSCASFGGIPKASPNPTKAVGVMDLVKDKPVLNLPGCPYNVVNLTATVVHYLTFGALPEMDSLHRPLFAYGALIHNNCERRGHFDRGEFVLAWGDAGAQQGWCLYRMGCKGPVTYHNCPSVRWNEGTNWPIGGGHGCISCSEPDFWERPTYEPVRIDEVAPPATYTPITAPAEPIPAINAGVVGAVLGAAVGVVGTIALNQLRKKETSDEDEEPETQPETPPDESQDKPE